MPNEECGPRAGLFLNIVLVIVKLLAGIAGHSSALVADAIESFTDIFSSLIVWGGLRITTRPATKSIRTAMVKPRPLPRRSSPLCSLRTVLGVAVAAVGEILTPQHMPAPFTLAVVAAVIPIKKSCSGACFAWVPRRVATQSRPTHGTIAATH